MKPRRRNQRLGFIVTGAIALASALVLTLTALSQNIDYFYSPSKLVEDDANLTRRLRIGGLVEDGSVREGEGVATLFRITDGGASLTVRYDGILPDLFREGQGVIAQGRFPSEDLSRLENMAGTAIPEDVVFIADTVLAKHDENYKPRELEKALEEAGHPTAQTE